MLTHIPSFIITEARTHTVDLSRHYGNLVAEEVNDDGVETVSLNLVVARGYEALVCSEFAEVTVPLLNSAELELCVGGHIADSPEHSLVAVNRNHRYNTCCTPIPVTELITDDVHSLRGS